MFDPTILAMIVRSVADKSSVWWSEKHVSMFSLRKGLNVNCDMENSSRSWIIDLVKQIPAYLAMFHCTGHEVGPVCNSAKWIDYCKTHLF